MARVNEVDLIELQTDRATKWLAEKWTGSKNCPICQKDHWTITGVMVMQSFGVTATGQAGDVFPVFHAVCTTCGFLRSFNAVIAGLTEPLVDLDSGEVSGN